MKLISPKTREAITIMISTVETSVLLKVSSRLSTCSAMLPAEAREYTGPSDSRPAQHASWYSRAPGISAHQPLMPDFSNILHIPAMKRADKTMSLSEVLLAKMTSNICTTSISFTPFYA